MFGERLKLARKKAGYSLRGLADALDGRVSAQALGKYERGEMMPGSDVLWALSKILGVSLEYLLSEQVEALEEVEFRKLAKTSAGARARVEAEVIDNLQRYIAIEEILELDSAQWRAPPCNNRFIGEESEGDVLADDLRSEWELGIDPIPNMTSLLEDRGIKVVIMPLPNGVSGLTCLIKRPKHEKRLPVIVINRDVTLERRRLTLAHELAHRLIAENSPVDHEKASNVFAGAFLIPRAHLVREVGKRRKGLAYQELIQLKRMYRVSAAALIVRLHQVEIIDQSTLAYAFQTFAKGWRKEEPEALEPQDEQGQHEIPGRFNRLCYWALAERLISPGKACELLQQPLSVIEQAMKGPARADADHHQ
jgi:Zn-dependent peptidase ImmA (M78 family)/DNA-binding XRE family transcriptional regulator